METMDVGTKPDLFKSGEYATYVNRFVRRLFLRRLVHDSHPVLQVENHLVQDAAAKLTNRIIYTFSTLDAKTQSRVIDMIRKSIKKKILVMSEDDDVKSDLLERLECESFEEIVPKNIQ